MSRQPAWLTDLVPTLGDDGLDISTIGLRDHTPSLSSGSVPPRTTQPSKSRKPHPQRPQESAATQGGTRTQTHRPAAPTSATTPSAGTSAVPVPIITAAPASAAAPSSASTSTSAQRRQRADRRARNSSTVSDNLDTSEYVNLDLNQLHVDSDSDDIDVRPSRRPPNGASHSRSMSNPFPSLFAPKKKKQRGHSPSGYGDSASSGEDEPIPPLPVQPRIASQAHAKIGAASGSGGVNNFLTPASASHGRRPSFSTGPCITCGSLMRWAQGVEAFRCGICLTVNDLVSATGKPSSDKDKSRTASVGPISIDETRSIINKCIHAYLEAVLCDHWTAIRTARDTAL